MIALLDPQEHRLLGRAVHELYDWSNVAYPTPGWWLSNLVSRGLMTFKIIHRGIDANAMPRRVWIYWPTPAGRKAYLSYATPYVPMSPEALAEIALPVPA